MAEKKDIQVVLSEMVRRMNEHGRRLRAVEERTSLLESRLGSIQDMILKNNEKARDNMKHIESEFKDMTTTLMKIENDIAKLNKNLDRFAKKSELKQVENLISLFNPLRTSFITKEELKRILEKR